MTISEQVKAWTGEVRTLGFEVLWQRLSAEEREEFVLFARDLDGALELEAAHHWQDAADRYKSIAETYAAFSDIAIARASHIVSEKLNRSIRYYNQGVRSVEQRQYNKALQFFDLALGVDAKMQLALYNLAMTYKIMYISDPVQFKLSKINAVDSFTKLLKLNPQHAKAAAQIEQLQKL